ncbi:MAG: hypothetical protein U1D33_00595, partial [bacterium]|nr:hypothetical protein [bacterium]
MADGAKIIGDRQITFSWAGEHLPQAGELRLSTKKDPDIPISIQRIEWATGLPRKALATVEATLDPSQTYRLIAPSTKEQWMIAPSLFGTVI